MLDRFGASQSEHALQVSTRNLFHEPAVELFSNGIGAGEGEEGGDGVRVSIGKFMRERVSANAIQVLVVRLGRHLLTFLKIEARRSASHFRGRLNLTGGKGNALVDMKNSKSLFVASLAVGCALLGACIGLLVAVSKHEKEIFATTCLAFCTRIGTCDNGNYNLFCTLSDGGVSICPRVGFILDKNRTPEWLTGEEKRVHFGEYFNGSQNVCAWKSPMVYLPSVIESENGWVVPTAFTFMALGMILIAVPILRWATTKFQKRDRRILPAENRL